ncbi:MAG: hypothetical protein JXJ20_15550 [Anaerolineae bacterium]|nr:hypothetical protein [Anaerolineae bacterium]
MWTFSTHQIAFSVKLYKELFTNESFYEELIPLVLPSLVKEFDEPELEPGELALGEVVDNLDHRDWEQIAPGLVPADWVKQEVERNLDDFFSWMEGDRDALVIVFHTEPLRRQLYSPAASHAIDRIIEALPVCSPDEEAEFELFAQGLEGHEYTYCQPTRPDLIMLLRNKLIAAKNELADDVPGEIDIVEEFEAGAREEAEREGKEIPDGTFSRVWFNEMRAGIRLWKRLVVLVFLIPASLLSLIVIFAVRSSKSFFRWMGCPLILGSLLTLTPLLFLPFMLPDIQLEWRTDIEQELETGGSLVGEIISEGMLRLAVGEFTRPILAESAIVIGIGFFFLVLSVLLSDPDAPPDEAYPAGYTQQVYQTPSGSAMQELATRVDDTPPLDRTPPPENSI